MPVVPASGSASDMRNLSLSEVEMHATALSGPEGVLAQNRPCHVHPRRFSPPIIFCGCRYHRPVFGCLFFSLVRRCRLLERCFPLHPSSPRNDTALAVAWPWGVEIRKRPAQVRCRLRGRLISDMLRAPALAPDLPSIGVI